MNSLSLVAILPLRGPVLRFKFLYYNERHPAREGPQQAHRSSYTSPTPVWLGGQGPRWVNGDIRPSPRLPVNPIPIVLIPERLRLEVLDTFTI
jgi:hypothetical protein